MYPARVEHSTLVPKQVNMKKVLKGLGQEIEFKFNDKNE
jgi:hypothetical protein